MFPFFALYARIIECKKYILIKLKRTLNNYKFFSYLFKGKKLG